MMTYMIRPWDAIAHDQVCMVDRQLDEVILSSGDDFVAVETALLRHLVSFYAVRLHGGTSLYELRDELIADFTAHLDEQLEWSKSAVDAVGAQ